MNKSRFNNKNHISILFSRIFRFLMVFAGLILILLLFAWLAKPNLSSNKEYFSKKELKEIEKLSKKSKFILEQTKLIEM